MRLVSRRGSVHCGDILVRGSARVRVRDGGADGPCSAGMKSMFIFQNGVRLFMIDQGRQLDSDRTYVMLTLLYASEGADISGMRSAL